MPQSLACPNLPNVRRLAAGELPEAEAEQFEQHVLTCLACAEELNTLQTSDPFTKEVQVASVIPPLGDQAMDELIERLIRTPPDMAMPTFKGSDEPIAAVRQRRLRAAEAKRQILVAKARGEERLRHQGELTSADSDEADVAPSGPLDHVLALDEALNKLQAVDEESARLVLLRYFARLTLDEAADILGISPPSAHRRWVFAKAWLHREIQGGSRPL
jgi:ECF sigma factor